MAGLPRGQQPGLRSLVQARCIRIFGREQKLKRLAIAAHLRVGDRDRCAQRVHAVLTARRKLGRTHVYNRGVILQCHEHVAKTLREVDGAAIHIVQ
mgnify:CR=1 FL=1